MTDLLVIVPSRGRPANAGRLMTACRDAQRATLLFGLDDDDPTLPEYMKVLTGPERPNRLEVSIGPRLGMCGTLNDLAVRHHGRFQYVGFAGDDHLPRTPGWDAQIVAALDELGPGGIVYGNDLFQGANLPTAVFMDSKIVGVLGYMAPPFLQHMFLDDAWRDWGLAADCLRYLPEVIVEHLHPEAGKAPEDDNYGRVRGLMGADGDAYARYKAAGRFDFDVAKIKALRG